MPNIPLQKWLQRAGVGSRQTVRRLMVEGRVTVDGETIRRFAEILPVGATVRVDGQRIETTTDRAVYLMHKPKKHVTAVEDAFGRPALGQYLPADAPYLFPVGRLDFNSEGALLWTNDGLLGRRVLHPRWKLPKLYGVKIRGHLQADDPRLEMMRHPMDLGDVTTLPTEVELGVLRTRATWVQITLHEGKSRQIRRMCRRIGLQIVKLRRLAIGPIELGELNPRCVRSLSAAELCALEEALELAPRRHSPGGGSPALVSPAG